MTDYTQSADAAGWARMDSVPIKQDGQDPQNILLGYFGYDPKYFGVTAVGYLFQWEKMPKPLSANWPYSWPDPTHWHLLPPPPRDSAQGGTP